MALTRQWWVGRNRGCLRLASLWLAVAAAALLWGLPGGQALAAAGKAAEPVATVVAVRGEVTARNGAGTVRKLAIKDLLYLEDTITSGASGRAQIMFKDNTIFSLGSKTVLKLTDYRWDPNTKQGKLATEVKEGVFRVMGGLITKSAPEHFEVGTPSSVIGIRGSMYSGRVAGDKVAVMFEGGRGITLRSDAGLVVISTPGFGSTVASRQAPPSPPVRFSVDTVQQLYQGLQAHRGGGRPGASGPGTRAAALPPPSFPAGELAAFNRGGGRGAGQPLANLTAAVKATPDQAAAVLRDAVVKDGVAVDKALDAVLRGMVNPERQQFDAVVREAMDHGLTVDQAKGIVERLKASGGVCQ